MPIKIRMVRRTFSSGSLRLSFLDSEEAGHILIALHGHWMEAATFLPFAGCLQRGWRLIALDQRGHGESDHAASYRRSDYISDIEALFEHLRIESAVLLGHSLGGVNAYQFAAQHPEQTQGLIIEDIGPTVSGDVGFMRSWGGTFKDKSELEERIGPRLLPYVEQSFRHMEDGWRLAFDPTDEEPSQKHLNGDHWQDWLASDCKALVIRGDHSPITKEPEMKSMVERRRNSSLLTLSGGHVVHSDDLRGFCDAVNAFLATFEN